MKLGIGEPEPIFTTPLKSTKPHKPSHNAFNDKFKLRDCLIDLGVALLAGIVNVALMNSTINQLEQLKKYRKKNSRNLDLKATRKQIKYVLDLKLTQVSITFTSLDSVVLLILNILVPSN